MILKKERGKGKREKEAKGDEDEDKKKLLIKEFSKTESTPYGSKDNFLKYQL
jgi:hypothetical protein